MIAVLAPGQGSQTPGMFEPWLSGSRAEQADSAANLARWSEATGLDLVRLGTTADAEEIKDTAVTQPLVVAASLLVHKQLLAALESAGLALPEDTVTAGFSAMGPWPVISPFRAP